MCVTPFHFPLPPSLHSTWEASRYARTYLHTCASPLLPPLAPEAPPRFGQRKHAHLRGDRTKTKAGAPTPPPCFHIPICEGPGAPVCVYLYACQTAVGRTHKRGKERGEKEGGSGGRIGGQGRRGVFVQRRRLILLPSSSVPPRDCNFLLNAIRGCEGLLPREPKKRLKEEKWYYKVHRL